MSLCAISEVALSAALKSRRSSARGSRSTPHRAHHTLRDAVTDQGYGAMTAGDGLEALALLRSGKQPLPSVVALDIRMPKMDGLQFLEEQKRDPKLAGIPVIVIAADRSDLNGTPVLRKTLDLGRLMDAIRGAMGS
jgi:CheY-like chemotaxis protein